MRDQSDNEYMGSLTGVAVSHDLNVAWACGKDDGGSKWEVFVFSLAVLNGKGDSNTIKMQHRFDVSDPLLGVGEPTACRLSWQPDEAVGWSGSVGGKLWVGASGSISFGRAGSLSSINCIVAISKIIVRLRRRGGTGGAFGCIPP